MAILLLCIAFWSLQTLSDAKVLSPHLPNHVLMTAIIDKSPVKLERLSVRWEQDGRPVAEYKDQNLIFHKNRAQMPLEKFVDGNISLILVNITLNDSGNYTCLIQYGKQQEKVEYRLIIETHNLQLLDLSSKRANNNATDVKPFLQIGGYTRRDARPGDNVTLRCIFNTDPTMEPPMLTIRWSKDGVTMAFFNKTCCSSKEKYIREEDLYKRNTILYLGRVQKKDSGVYTCTIKYRTMEKSFKVTLSVKDHVAPGPRSMWGPHQSDDLPYDDLPSDNPVPTNVRTDEYRTTKMALVCGMVATTYFFTFIIFFCVH